MVGVLCCVCLSGALPFVGLLSDGEFRGALREYREGLGSRAAEFEGLRLDPYDDEVRGALGGLDGALRGCGHKGGGEVAGGAGDHPVRLQPIAAPAFLASI